MIFSWMFDFRADSAGSGLMVQLVFFTCYLIGFFLFLVRDNGGRMKVPGLLPLLSASGLFVLIGLLSGLLNGQTYYDIFRNSFTLIIYITAVIVTVRLIEQVDARNIRPRLAWLCFGFSLSSLAVLMATTGVDLSSVRFQILGASTLSSMGYLVLSLLFTLTLPETATLLASLGLVFLSITRTLFVTQFFQLLPAWPALYRLMTPRVLISALIGVAVLAGAATLTSTAFDRWNQRMFRNGDTREDPTAYTRRVETEFMLEHWLHDGQSVMLGTGLASRTEYYEPKWVGGAKEESIGFGHDQHVSILFIAGLIGGVPLLLVHFWQLWASMQFIYRVASRTKRYKNDVLFLGCWGATGIIGHVVSNFLQADFGNRGVSLWYGITTGLFLGARACLDRRNSFLSEVHEDLQPQLATTAAAPARQHPAAAASVPAAVQRRRQMLARLREKAPTP
ncbi:MAG TPA: hypothetical protein VN222_14240 [Novosphingobium sp.]|nr:hypothetical protein [Novosphingobium sp.]